MEALKLKRLQLIIKVEGILMEINMFTMAKQINKTKEKVSVVFVCMAVKYKKDISRIIS